MRFAQLFLKNLELKIIKDMTITEKEIREDFARFIRHEAMRANCTQEEVRQIITGSIHSE